ncbi:GGDEF domain-containing protein [Paenibacillus soyae]|uniref:GGDEF domain-containing protein n=1 Tax=Paenibacillus soyae TaxID=2969249 RepID=A0A9X2SBN6_9BACL|nr:GGDEF domain-containing protein [Paenibacillus soyae]MCR2805838.1 GGDEF domain-containing protein [Paenibacillus soyae]
MKYKGRLLVVSITLSLHTVYILYYYLRDGMVDMMDILGYPLFFALAYWAGHQYDKALYYSEKDVLTNLYNRRFVIQSFDKIAAIASRTSSNLFVLLLDCDNFKEINDVYNHQIGDTVLQRISQILQLNTRKIDIVSRWGGDEFLVLGQYKEQSGVEVLMGRIQKEIAALSDEMGFRVSISIGSAVYNEKEHKDLSSLIKTADENMYRTKATKKHS